MTLSVYQRTCLYLVPALIAATTAQAQTPVFGVEQSGVHQLYSSEATNFVNQWSTVGGGTGSNIFAMDFDLTGTTLWAIDYDTSERGTIDLTTGAFTPMGPTGIPAQTVVAATCKSNGSWLVLARVGTSMQMYGGDLTSPGKLVFFNFIHGHIFADIAYSSDAKLLGISATDGQLYGISELFGDYTPIMDLGASPGLSHGLDFDWRDNTLWASINTGSGAGELLAIRGATQTVTTTESTNALGGSMLIAVQSPFLNGEKGTLFCDPMAVNSTGLQTTLSGTMPLGTAELHLEAINGPPSNFAYLLVGTGQNDPGIAIGNGFMCLNASAPNQIGRYNITGSPLNSIGAFSQEGRLFNLFGNSSIGSGFDIPQILPFASAPMISSGQTFHFQLWHRDAGTGLNSNFSNGLSVTF